MGESSLEQYRKLRDYLEAMIDEDMIILLATVDKEMNLTFGQDRPNNALDLTSSYLSSRHT